MDSHPLRGSRERTHAPDVRGLNFRSFPILPLLLPVVMTRNLHRTFMTLRNPGIALRALVLAAQGVFYNIFCTFSPLLLYKFECSREPSNQSPVVYYFPKNLPPFRRLPRRRGRGDVYARNRGARTGPSPHMVRTSWSRAVTRPP